MEVTGNDRNYGIYSDDVPFTKIHNSQILVHNNDIQNNEAVGLYFYDANIQTENEVSQTVIDAGDAKPSNETDIWLNSNVGVKIYSDGLFAFTRDTIRVPKDFGDGMGPVGAQHHMVASAC